MADNARNYFRARAQSNADWLGEDLEDFRSEMGSEDSRMSATLDRPGA